MRSACASGKAAVILILVPFHAGHSTLPSALDLDPSTLRSALVALVQSSVLLACFRSSVEGLQSKLSWSLLSCYCGHCGCSCGCSSWLLLRRLLCYSSGLGCSSGCSFWLLCGRFFWLPLRCSFLLIPWALLFAASTGALSCLLLRMLLRWLLLGLLLSRDCFRCCC